MLVVGLLATALVATQGEVVERGALLPSNPDLDVTRVELGNLIFNVSNRIDVWIDAVNGLLLAFLSGVALLAAFLVARLGAAHERRLEAFYLLLALGGGVLALDESLELSESLEFNIQGLIVTMPAEGAGRELDVFLYLVPAICFVAYFRDVLLGVRRARPWLAFGLGIFALGMGLDLVDGPAFEWPEVIASLCLVAGFLNMAVDHVSGLASPRAEPADRSPQPGRPAEPTSRLPNSRRRPASPATRR